jgi:hypothetical protein
MMQIAAGAVKGFISALLLNLLREKSERGARDSSSHSSAGIRIYLLLIVFNTKDAERKYD